MLLHSFMKIFRKNWMLLPQVIIAAPNNLAQITTSLIGLVLIQSFHPGTVEISIDLPPDAYNTAKIRCDPTTIA
jgi:hypothetical protein